MFTYDRVPRSLIRNGYIPPSIKNTFVVLRSYCNIHTRQGEVYIRELAADTQRTNRTICEHLSWLIENEFIHRQLRKKKDNPKENDKSLFTILRWDLPEDGKISVPTEKKFRDKDLEREYRDIRTKETNIREAETSSGGFSTPSYVTPETPSEAPKVCEANLNETNCGKPEVQLPKQKTISKAETVKHETAPKGYDLSGLPEILHPTAIFYLDQTGRTELTEKDKQILCELLENHYPARIQGEILYRLKLFMEELGRTPRQLTLSYIYAILKNQRSRPLDEPETEAPQAVTDPQTEAIYERVVSKPRKSNKKVAKHTPKAERKEQSIPAPVELVMPVEDAEKVIADYEAEHTKKPEPTPAPAIPVALEELFTKMAEKELERGEEYSASLPKDEYGDPVWPEEDDGAWHLTLEDYLHLKYPEAEEEELHRDYSGQVYGSVSEHKEASRIKTAFEIDYVCATCMNPEECQLPEGFKKGQDKLVTKMFHSKDGKKCLGTGFEGCIKCKHDRPKPTEKTPEEKHREAEFERMLARSEIMHKEKTFKSYRPETPELKVVKAMAILAVKKQRNLVLAGRAGTGKTHLATAIAIEAMKTGRQAVVVTACEMLNKITQANRDNTDPLGVLLHYKSVPVLVIDDWDKARMTEARLDYLYQIVNDRYERGLQTVVTTNAYDMAGLESRWYPGKIEPMMSRLLQNGDWVTIREAENYRLKPKPVIPAPVAEPEEARVGEISLTEQTRGIVLTVPRYDDGLDDDEGDSEL